MSSHCCIRITIDGLIVSYCLDQLSAFVFYLLSVTCMFSGRLASGSLHLCILVV